MKGIDISQWQPVGIDLSGQDFVIVKATEGVGFTDPNCDGHYQNAKAQGKLLGVYHFARPDGNAAEAEAEWFVSQIQGYIGEAILVLDFEVNTWDVAWAKRWLDKVHELTGVKPLIYISAYPANAYDWSSVANADYGLFLAGYPAEYNVPNPPTPTPEQMPFGTGAWGFWAIWQYSSSAGTLDRDIANMDENAWRAYAARNGETPHIDPTPAPAPAPAPDYQTYTVVSGDTLSNIAARFGTTYQKIAQDNGIANVDLIFPGTVLRIYGGGGGGGQSSPRTVTHVVQAGETLSGIAAQYGTTYQKIAADNGIPNPDYIQAGQVLTIYL